MNKDFRVTRNQEGVINNPYQGLAKRVLCVCSAGVLRSPTIAEQCIKRGFNARSAGVNDEYALIKVSPQLLLWADAIIIVSERCQDLEYKIDLFEKNTGFKIRAKIFPIDIEDCYSFRDVDLVAFINDFLDTMEY